MSVAHFVHYNAVYYNESHIQIIWFDIKYLVWFLLQMPVLS